MRLRRVIRGVCRSWVTVVPPVWTGSTGRRARILAIAVLAGLSAAGLISPASAQSPLLFFPEVFVRGVRQLPLAGVTWGGPIQSVAANPLSPNELLAASQTGGLFKSIDGGTTWSHVDALPVSDLSAVAYNQDATLMLVTARNDWRQPRNGAGIWSSDDGGENWKQVRSVPASTTRPGPTGGTVTKYCRTRPMAFGIAVDPSSERIFVATNCGVYQSNNKGVTFGAGDLGDDADGTPRVFYSVAVVPPNPALPTGAVAAGGPSGMYYLEGSGRSASLRAATSAIGLTSNGPDGNFRNSITHSVSQRFPQDLFAAVDAIASDTEPAIVWSRDGGRTWQMLPGPSDADYSDNCGGSPFVRTSLEPGAVSMFLYYGNRCHVWRVTLPGEDPAVLLDPDESKRPAWRQLVLQHADPHESLVAAPSQLIIATDGGIEICTEYPLHCPTYGVRGAGAGLNALQATRVNGQKIIDWPRFRSPESHVYMSTWHTGVWASADGGDNWAGLERGEGDSLDMSRVAATRSDAVIGLNWCADCNNYVTGPLFEGFRGWPDVMVREDTRSSAPPTFIRYFGSVFAQRSATAADGSALWVQTHVTTGATAANTRIASLITCSAGRTGCDILNARSEAIFPGYATLVPPNPALYAVVEGNVTYEGATVPRYSLVYLDAFLATTGGPADVRAYRTDVWFQWMSRDRARGYVGFGVNPAAGLRRVVFAADPQAIGHLIAPDVNHDFPGQVGMRESFDGGNTWMARPDLTRLVTGTDFVATPGEVGRPPFRFDIDTREQPTSFPTGQYWPLVSAISFFPDNAQLVLLGTMCNGLFFSNDRGLSWRRVVGSELIPNINDMYWKSANTVIVASAGRGLWELQLGHRAPLERLSPLCRECRVLPVIPIPTDRLAANAVTDATPGFDSALVVLDGRVQDATFTANGVAGVALGPGSTWLTFSDSQFEPGFPISEQSKPGSFDGLPQVADLVQQGFVIHGLTFAQGRLHGILYGLSELPLPPAPFVPMTKKRGRKTLDLDGPYLTLFATELRGSSVPPVATLTVTGQNFKPNGGPVIVSIQGRVLFQAVPVDQDGKFALTIRLSLPAGQYDMLATQRSSKKNPIQASIGFNVTHADDRGEEKQP